MQLLSPGMEYAQEADLRPQVLGIYGDLTECCSAALEQQVVDGSLVLQGKRSQIMGKREDHMRVADAEKLSGTSREPFVAGVGLALWAMPVSAREEGDDAMPTSGALIEVTAERCCTAVLDGPQHFDLLPTQVRLVSLDEAVARGTDDVGDLQGG